MDYFEGVGGLPDLAQKLRLGLRRDEPQLRAAKPMPWLADAEPARVAASAEDDAYRAAHGGSPPPFDWSTVPPPSGPEPTPFAAGAIPSVVACGADPRELLKINLADPEATIAARFAAAHASTMAEFVATLERFTGQYKDAELIELNQPAEAALADYRRRVFHWESTP